MSKNRTPLVHHALRSEQGYTGAVAIKREIRDLLIFAVGWVVVCVVVFLFASRFFHGWDGHAVSVLPTRSPDPAVYTVLIAEDDRSLQVEWPAEVVGGLGLPVDSLAVPPTTIPAERPRTRKSLFQLHFLVQTTNSNTGTGAWRAVPTSSPQAFALALVLFLIGLGVRNMVYAGTPFSLQKGKVLLPKGLATSGAPAPGGRVRRSRKGPPPGKKRRGRRR